MTLSCLPINRCPVPALRMHCGTRSIVKFPFWADSTLRLQNELSPVGPSMDRMPTPSLRPPQGETFGLSSNLTVKYLGLGRHPGSRMSKLWSKSARSRHEYRIPHIFSYLNLKSTLVVQSPPILLLFPLPHFSSPPKHVISANSIALSKRFEF